MIRGRGSRILQRQKNCWDGNLKSNCERACLSWKRISDNGLAFLKGDVQSNFPYTISEESECCRVDNFFAIEAFLSHKNNGCVGTGIQINECFIQLVFLLFLRRYDCCYDTVFGGHEYMDVYPISVRLFVYSTDGQNTPVVCNCIMKGEDRNNVHCANNWFLYTYIPAITCTPSVHLISGAH